MKTLFAIAIIGLSASLPHACLGAPKITGEVTLSATQVVKSEIELIDLTPGTPEYAAAVAAGIAPENLATSKSINYRVNLLTDGVSQAILSERFFSTYLPLSGGPEFQLRDVWLNGNLCMLVIQHSMRARAYVLVKQANGNWAVSDQKVFRSVPEASCTIRKTSPQTIVQNKSVNGTPTSVDLFTLSGTTLVPVP